MNFWKKLFPPTVILATSGPKVFKHEKQPIVIELCTKGRKRFWRTAHRWRSKKTLYGKAEYSALYPAMNHIADLDHWASTGTFNGELNENHFHWHMTDRELHQHYLAQILKS